MLAWMMAASLALVSKAPVAVIGSTGRLGRPVVEELVAQGYPARCLLRHELPPDGGEGEPTTSAQVAGLLAKMPGVTMVKGDINDPASLNTLLQGAGACIAVHGARRTTRITDMLPWTHPERDDPTHSRRINYVGMMNLVAAAKASGSVRRIVRITGKGEDPWSIFSILINGLSRDVRRELAPRYGLRCRRCASHSVAGLGSMAKAWNYEGECVLRGTSDIDYTIIRPGIMGQLERLSDDVSLT